ncbi:MAG: PucR family transcriptional regulator [Actinobacteria bacterium]|uniref:Unannotated protein n=1 Tax=freshwater metagenome TaxID=449393 RepID=A0A6J5YJJ8_9ZZZZ|nr:PucR family transcriptional regulator [Actinomycetota bacterium]
MVDSHSHLTPQRHAAERAVLARRLQRVSGELTTSATTRMDQLLPWFQALPARERATVGTLAQLGVRTFVDWFTGDAHDPALTERIFTSAPRELAELLTLEQTVELVRITIAVVEESVETIAGDNLIRQAALRESILRYSSEVAFAAASVYARLAENRGAWDARLQSLVLDSILTGGHDDSLEARAIAAGWTLNDGIVTLVGSVPSSRVAAEVHVAQIQRTARSRNLDALVGVHSDRLVAVISGVPQNESIEDVARPFIVHFGPGAVVSGPWVATLRDAHNSATAALSGYKAVPMIELHNRLVTHDDLLSARALDGDTAALDSLVNLISHELRADVRTTLAVFLERATGIESCARLLYVHVNTVRYRLAQVRAVTGFDPADPEDALALRLALMMSRKTQNL